MRRREFLAVAAVAPFLGIGRNLPAVESTELMPNRLFLPGIVWSSMAFIGQVNHGFVYFDARVTAQAARRLARAINDEWRELPEWFSFYLGFMDDPISQQWLTGEGWERRVRIAEAFFRNGAFVVELHSDGILLLREDQQ
ncbi:MAG: hypothetical protein HUJ26_00390 [Planctomycetaceae bacterium]|nr:hypothetical protein [Planctomycetaceae bacterium]